MASKRVEILAPAGSFESLKAGIQAGADAVYAGGTLFGARAFADNLDGDSMLRAIDYVHVRGKKIFLTLNTLLTDTDIKERLYSFLAPYYRHGIDAVIVQDVGVLRFIRNHFPDLDIHASTQMSITMAQGADLLARYGVSRLIPSRELSLREISHMRRDTSLELEVFVHGALCYSYSGQCLMSAALGGRSGNKGMCAGPCRLPYVHNGEKGRFLCLKDLCSLSLIGRLVEAGVDSFKIEGRMKKPEYTAITAHYYRKYTDYCMEMGVEGFEKWIREEPREYREDVRKLMDVYNRGGFTSGYFILDNQGRDNMTSPERPGHYGVCVGRVIQAEKGKARFRLKEAVHGGDVLEFRDAKGGTSYEYTVGKDGLKGDVVEANTGSSTGICVGDAVFRTRNKALLDEIASRWLIEGKVMVKAEFTARLGEKARLQLTEGDAKVICLGEVVKKAEKRPVTLEGLRDKLTKTGNTPFLCNDLTIDMDEGIFLSLSGLNELRRQAYGELERTMAGPFRRNLSGRGVTTGQGDRSREEWITDGADGITVSVCSKEQWEAVRESPPVRRIYLSTEELGLSALPVMLKADDKDVYLMLPSLFKEEAYRRYQRWWTGNLNVLKPRIAGFVIRNFEEYHFVKTVADPGHEKEWVLYYNMYVENGEAYRFWRENGIDKVEKAPVYGYLPLMVSANCLIRNRSGCIKTDSAKPNPTIQIITDEKKRKFRVVNHCDSCYNTIYGGKAVWNKDKESDGGRFDFTVETGEEVKRIIKHE